MPSSSGRNGFSTQERWTPRVSWTPSAVRTALRRVSRRWPIVLSAAATAVAALALTVSALSGAAETQRRIEGHLETAARLEAGGTKEALELARGECRAALALDAGHSEVRRRLRELEAKLADLAAREEAEQKDAESKARAKEDARRRIEEARKAIEEIRRSTKQADAPVQRIRQQLETCRADLDRTLGAAPDPAAPHPAIGEVEFALDR